MNDPVDQARKDANKGRGWRFYLACALGVLALIVVFQNTDETQVKFLFAQTTMPLIFALLIAIGVGILIGYLTPKVRRSNRHEKRIDPDRD